MASASEMVHLRGGPALPVSAVVLALELEARGVALVLDGGDLLVAPPDRVTPEDIRAVRTHKPDLVALVRYCDESREVMR